MREDGERGIDSGKYRSVESYASRAMASVGGKQRTARAYSGEGGLPFFTP